MLRGLREYHDKGAQITGLSRMTFLLQYYFGAVKQLVFKCMQSKLLG
jgi:hypothetical protein